MKQPSTFQTGQQVKAAGSLGHVVNCTDRFVFVKFTAAHLPVPFMTDELEAA